MSELIANFPEKLYKNHLDTPRGIPSKSDAAQFLDRTMELLFPNIGGQEPDMEDVAGDWLSLQMFLLRLLRPLLPAGEEEALAVVERFFERLTAIYEELLDDSRHFAECDPACECPEEVVVSYPGFFAIAVHRIAHELHRLKISVLPRMLAELAHSRTGIDIHPGAEIGRRFFIDHGTGVVIGETTVIGNNVTVYQGVTLGATFVRKSLQGLKRHPTIEDGVILYAGCTILGGDTVVGAGSIVGGNVWLTESIPPGTKIFYKPNIIG